MKPSSEAQAGAFVTSRPLPGGLAVLMIGDAPAGCVEGRELDAALARLRAAVAAALDEATARETGRCARVCERMVVVGRAWTQEQEMCAKALFEAAENIRRGL